MQEILNLYSNIGNLTWQMVVMWIVGGVMIYLGIVKKMEPSLLVPMGFGAILVNLPLSGAVTQTIDGVIEKGPLDVLFNTGISTELFLLLLFIGIGAMIDFTPLLANPAMMLFGAAAQFGIFLTLSLATLFGFSLTDAASVGIIGAADGPTSIFVANYFNSKYLGAIIVAAYSSGHPPDHIEEGVPDPHDLQPEVRVEDHEDPVPDHDHGRRGSHFPAVCRTDRLPDVRKPGQGVRRSRLAL